MTTCAVQTSAAIELYFYDELNASERAFVGQHLRTCRGCRAALDELTMIRAALASRSEIAAPPGGDWAPFMARLEAAVARERQRSKVMPITRPRPVDRARLRVRHNLASYVAMAAILTLATTSVVYLARTRGARPPETTTVTTGARPITETPPPTPAAAGSTVIERRAPSSVDTSAAGPERTDAAFASVSEQHFERSKLVVLGLAAKNPSEASAEDWSYERQLASSLLDDTRLYRHAAQERGMKTLAGVLSDLELVLLQASMSDERDRATLERIQRLIRKRDLMTKMNAVTTAGI